MKLSASPFHPTTGTLLPAYRDAYLRGDLSGENTVLVDSYLQSNKGTADEILLRFYDLKQKGHQVKPVGWVQRQFDLMRTEPERFRRRAASLLVGGALISGAVFAGTNLPTENTPVETSAVADAAELPAEASAASAVRMVTVRGRILDENGKPLVGATVLDRTHGQGVSTDATGSYAILVPANRASHLQYGYGGYTEEEVQLTGRSKYDVTLLPRTAKSKTRHWWQF